MRVDGLRQRERVGSGVGKIVGVAYARGRPPYSVGELNPDLDVNEPAGCMGEQPQRRRAWSRKSRSATPLQFRRWMQPPEAAVVTDLVGEKGKESVVSACACPCVPTFEALIGPVAPCSLQLAVSQLNVVVMTTAGHVTRQPIRVLEDGSLNTAWCIRTLTADPNLSLCRQLAFFLNSVI